MSERRCALVQRNCVSMQCRLYPPTRLFMTSKERYNLFIIYTWIVHRWILNHWIVYCEVAQPLLKWGYLTMDKITVLEKCQKQNAHCELSVRLMKYYSDKIFVE